jgi:hypothetical protein
VARRPSFRARYPRWDFSGKLAERAYLLGFRLGDLHVALEELSVVVKCTSTGAEQVDLFQALFGPYGHVYTSTSAPAAGNFMKRVVRMQVGLNRTFEFLVPKEDRVPEWVLAGDEAFYAYFAGYLDAEGYVKTCLPRGYLTEQVRVEIRSYDRNVLTQLGLALNERGIVCPPAKARVRAGYTNKAGIRSNGELWGLGISRKDSLDRLFQHIDPHVRHARRRRDMERAWAVVTSPGRLATATDAELLAWAAVLKKRKASWIRRE